MDNSQLKVGFARVNINPMVGIGIVGYYKPRFAKGILDDLEINAVAISKNNKTILLMTFDVCQVSKPEMDEFIDYINKATGVDKQAIFIHATHTHTGPFINRPEVANTDLEKEYFTFLQRRFGDCAKYAINDLKNAKMGVAIGKAENVGFIRRFRMKDGSVQTNPGVNNPDIVAPIGSVDQRVNVMRFDRENADTIVIANYGNHPDVVGGDLISADWPGFFRRRLEKSLDNVKAIFFNGAQGDVNHVNVHPTKADFNDMFNDFDGVSRGYGHSRHIGNVVAGAVLQVYDKVEYRDVLDINYLKKIIDIPSNKPSNDELPKAREIWALHEAGKDNELPYTGMMLTTVVAEAKRMIKLENAPETFPMEFSAVSIGDVAFFGIPGEPFNGIGLAIKESKDWKNVFPCCLTNGAEGYFPMKEAYDEGGYESRSSQFKSGCAEVIIEKGLALLNELKNK